MLEESTDGCTHTPPTHEYTYNKPLDTLCGLLPCMSELTSGIAQLCLQCSLLSLSLLEPPPLQLHTLLQAICLSGQAGLLPAALVQLCSQLLKV